MAKRGRKPRELDQEELETIWEVSDELWARIELVLAELDPPNHTGRKRIDARAAFNAIIYQMRTGCQWNHLPKEFPDDSSVHRTFQRWIERGVLERIWSELVKDCEELGGVDWQWQAADGCLSKAPKRGGKQAPTPQIVRSLASSAAF